MNQTDRFYNPGQNAESCSAEQKSRKSLFCHEMKMYLFLGILWILSIALFIVLPESLHVYADGVLFYVLLVSAVSVVSFHYLAIEKNRECKRQQSENS